MAAKPKAAKVPKVPLAVRIAREKAEKAGIACQQEAALREAFQKGRESMATDIAAAAAAAAKTQPSWFARWFGPESGQ